jgi:fatty-acyl-CoA synthase
VLRETPGDFGRASRYTLGMNQPAAPTARPDDKPFWPARLPRDLVVPETTLWFNLEVSARRYPAKPACVFFGQPLSYRELHAQAEALAGWLQAQGVAAGRPGHRLPAELPAVPRGLLRRAARRRRGGAGEPDEPARRAGPLHHRSRGARGHHQRRPRAPPGQANLRLEPAQRLRQLLVTRFADTMPEPLPAGEEPPEAMLQWLRADTPLPAEAGCAVTRWTDALAAGHRPGPPEAGPDDLALLPYTSGTTGLPKGCLHTHRTLMPNAVGGALWGFASAETLSLAVVPMFHITGMLYGVISPVYMGSTVVIMPRWDRELAGRLISRHRVSHWTCIPTMIIDLFGSPNYRSFDLSSLRYLSGGGAAMPQAVAERLQAEFGITFAEGYGLTETAAPSHANPPERAKLQCLGMPIFGVDSRVVDPATLTELPAGEVGEIVTHGPMVFQGYWRHPEATAAAFFELDGKRFFRTGDLGRRDEEGYFFITDRLKRMINASGYKVWPSEVELLLFKCPLVQEACIIAARDDYRGETVKAVVVLRAEHRGHARPEDIVAWAREHMAAYKVPRLVEFVDALPKSGSGKVMWRLLQEAEQARTVAGA